MTSIPWRQARAAAVAVFVTLAFGAAHPAAAQQPTGQPVRWDQERVTKMSQDLAAAVHEARETVRRSPLQHNIAQRTTYYELLETLRLAENTAEHLKGELEAGKGAEETRPIFDRVNSLRFEAEEIGRRALVEDPVIDALVKAGSIHNQMKPYYYGKN